MAVSIQDIAKLRKLTGAGMMDVKKALEEAVGDFDKAIELLRKRGQALAAKRSDRDAEEGCVRAASAGDFAVVVGIKCETDFVAKGAEFIALTDAVLAIALEKRGASKEEVLAAPMADGRSVQDHITERSGVSGEKMELGIYEFVKGAATWAYIHPGNLIATVVAFNEPLEDQMAMNPVAVTEDEVPAEIKERELNLAREKAREAGKPENLIENIAQGALKKYYKDFTLLDQLFFIDNKLTVAQYLHSASKTLTATAFHRASLVAE